VRIKSALHIVFLFAVAALQSALGQAPTPPQAQSQSGGIATSAPQAAVYDSEHRPITAAAEFKQRQGVLSGGSYLSLSDMPHHFGLEDSTDAGTAEIHWPSGAKKN
jgi:hypothetical protein